MAKPSMKVSYQERICFPAEFAELSQVSKLIERMARKAGFDSAITYKVQLAVDEAISNIIEHAYGLNENGNIECTCKVSETALIIELLDYGQPFDPERIPDPDLTADINNRKKGGLGLFFIRQLMDEVIFTPGDPLSEQRANRLVLIKHKEPRL